MRIDSFNDLKLTMTKNVSSLLELSEHERVHNFRNVFVNADDVENSFEVAVACRYPVRS